MGGTITHKWNGTILTITSDSGTSSMDLKGSQGDLGPRGPQGPAGIIINADGTINFNGYATEQYVDDKIAAIDIDTENIDLSNYYTKSEVDAAIDGVDGEDGISATHSWDGTVLTITSASGTSSADLRGPEGPQGPKGADGTMSFEDLTEEQRASLKGDKGDQGEPGADGEDYILTDSDKTEIANIVLASLPNGNEVYY